MIVYEEGQNYIRIVEHIHDARVKTDFYRTAIISIITKNRG